jgi:hypothetical protein
MTLRKFLIVGAVLVAASCSKNEASPTSAIPTAPSPITLPDPGGAGVSHTTVVNYPQRSDTLDFRAQLESKYAGKGRTPAQVYVDQDGGVAWIQEYHRYRVNRMRSIRRRGTHWRRSTAPPPQVCAVRYFPETAIYPSREDSVDFRRQLGSKKCQAMGRSAQSAVDAEGAGIGSPIPSLSHQRLRSRQRRAEDLDPG